MAEIKPSFVKSIFLLTISLFSIWSIQCQDVDEKDAKRLATSFIQDFNKKRFTTSNSENFIECFFSDSIVNRIIPENSPYYKQIEAKEAISNSYFYIFNLDTSGFIVVSGSKKTQPILAFSTEARFADIDNVTFVKDWLSDITSLIALLDSLSITPDYDQNDYPRKNTSNSDQVGPLMADSWHQSAPYNMSIPTNVFPYPMKLGCVAVSMAQIMKYYNYPLEGQGSISYDEADEYPPNLGHIEVDFSGPFNWHLFKSDYGYSTDDEHGLSETMFKIAASVEMDFGDTASGAYMHQLLGIGADAHGALKEYFGYKVLYKGTLFGKNIWKNILTNEIDSKRPVIYSGPGHTFICDGYRSDEKFHFKLGQIGNKGDGWYFIDDITFTDQNGEDHDYSWEVINTGMLYGVQPDFENCLQDKYENDGSFENSKILYTSTKQLHSIAPLGDRDFYKFYVANTSNITIETIGVNGNTELALYNGLKQLRNIDDNSGDGVNSKLLVELDPGTYYFMIKEILNEKTIPSYILDFKIQPLNNSRPILSEMGVSPSHGLEDTDFKFMVKFYDIDGDVPTIKKVHIQGPVEKVLEMSFQGGSISNGYYSITTRLPQGSYNYYFEFSDGKGPSVISEIFHDLVVHTDGSLIIIDPSNIDICSDDIRIEFSVRDIDNNVKRWEWLGSELPAEVQIESDVDLSFSCSIFSENHVWVKWLFYFSDGSYRERSASGSGFHLNWGTVTASPYISYSPTQYSLSGIITDQFGNSITEDVTINLSSTVNDEVIATNTGSFAFSNINGGLPVTITPQLSGYYFGPNSYYFKNLTSDKTNLTFKAYSGDMEGPEIEVISFPPLFSDDCNVSIIWTGIDNTTPPNQIQYRFRLNEYEWSTWSSENSYNAILTNGCYTLEIEGIDEHGNISNPGAIIEFAINSNPRFVGQTKYDLLVYGTKVEYSCDSNKELTGTVILPEYTNGDPDMIPLKVFLNEPDIPFAVHPSLTESYPGAMILGQCGNNLSIDVAQIISSNPETINLIIEWGVVISFGWEKYVTYPSELPEITNNDISMRRISKIIPDDGKFYRFWTQNTRRNGVIGNPSLWIYMDIFNEQEVLISRMQLENLNGIPTNGQYAEEYSISEIKVIRNNKGYLISGYQDQSIMTYNNGSNWVYNSRIMIKQIDANGNVLDEYYSEWAENVIYSLVELENTGQMAIITKQNSPNRFSFSTLNSDLSLTSPVEITRAESNHYISFSKCLSIENKYFFFYIDSWEAPISEDDRQQLFLIIYDVNTSTLSNRITVGDGFVDDAAKMHDTYELDDGIIFNDLVVINYEHRLGGVSKFYEKHIDRNGNIIHSSESFDLGFYRVDNYNYLWENYGPLRIRDNNFNTIHESSGAQLNPNRTDNLKEYYIDPNGFAKRIQTESSVWSVYSDPGLEIDSLFIIPYDQNSTAASVKNLSVDIGEIQMGYLPGDLKNIGELDVEGFLVPGDNLLTFNQESYFGGDIIVAFYATEENSCENWPDWTINPSEFSFDGEIIAEIKIEDQLIITGGFLGAFVGDECRGVIEGVEGPTDMHVFILRIYSNVASGETITFKFFDTENCIEYEVCDPIVFEADMKHGDAVNPDLLTNNCSSVISKSLAEGWTWFSINVTADDMSIVKVLSNLTIQGGDYIKNQTESSTYYDAYGWFGALESIDPKIMYKIKLANEGELEFSGNPIDPSTNPISLNAGWTWLGYLPQDGMSLSLAMANRTNLPDDYIKNQTVSSTNYDDYGWFGSLENMIPLDGFMFKAGQTGTLTYPVGAPLSKVAYNESIRVDQFNSADFEYSGQVTAQVYLNGNIAGDEGDLLLTIIDDRTMGKSPPIIFPPTGLPVFNHLTFENSEMERDLTFYFYDSSEKQWYTFEESLKFKIDMIEYTAFDPFRLEKASKTHNPFDMNYLYDQSIQIYPNPASTFATVGIELNEADGRYLEIFDVYGRMVMETDQGRLTRGYNEISLDLRALETGVYFIRINGSSTPFTKFVVSR